MKYGLLGERLGHSFSKEIHEQINDYQYELKEVPFDKFDEFMTKHDFIAINVTIPYKEKVIPYLDYIDDATKKIGAVNTIVNKNGKLYGYNTDYLGLRDLVLTNNIDVKNKKVLILGTGGTSKTSKAVFTDLGAKELVFVSIDPVGDEISYEDAVKYHSDSEIIVNATPCGMYPNCDDLIIDISTFNKLVAVVDVIYNPLKTMLVRKALERGITAVSGLYMLVAQAVYASSIFTDTTYDKKIIDDIYKQIYNSKRNIVLIGMPTCGKTTISKVLADKLNKELVDTDTLVEQKMGTTIKEYLKTHDETSFRDIETKVINEVSKLNNLIISTGGGVIKRKNNIEYLKANGLVIFIDRPLELLQVSDTRPLSSNQSDLEKLYYERYNLYCNYADIIVKNDQDLELVINKIINEVK